MLNSQKQWDILNITEELRVCHIYNSFYGLNFPFFDSQSSFKTSHLHIVLYYRNLYKLFQDMIYVIYATMVDTRNHVDMGKYYLNHLKKT